jgi:hypothetical protein
LQNPLAPGWHAVFGLKTFSHLKPVPRKPKTSVETKPAEPVAAAISNGKESAPQPKKKTRAAAAPTKKKKPAAAKKPAKQPAEGISKRASEPTDDEIRLRAYFIAERRHKLSLPGDSNHDWIEARRQLIEEAQPAAS